MKKNIYVFLIVGVFSLACLQTSSGAVEVARMSSAAVVSATSAPTLRVVVPSPAEVVSSAGEVCARVSAEVAQNLRDEPGINTSILIQLDAGDIVRVINRDDADWWRVAADGREGFARSYFLQVVDCGE